MEVPVDKERKFVAVEFPGVVNNEENALKCLGGEASIKKVYGDKTKRLMCNFRPDCGFSKSACADRSPCTRLLLRVRRRKKQPSEVGEPSTAAGPSSTQEYEYEGRILGVVDEVFKFESMMDSQYLPVRTRPDGSAESIREQVVIDRLVNKEWLKQDVDLFLPPPIFSRIDRPIEYAYRDAQVHREGYTDPSVSRDPGLIGASRQRRPHYTRFATFDDPTPEKGMKEALEKFKNKITDYKQIDKLRQVFQERPIWSKNALKAQLDMSPDHYKIVLPTIAYFFTTGPWRSLWVRLGYDPRKDPSSKCYQLVDFRVRQKAAVDKLGIMTKRTTYEYHLPTSVVKGGSKPSVIQHETFGIDWTKDNVDMEARKTALEATYIFRPGLVPAYRQMFYQLIDVDEPRIQAVLHENDGQETECTERDGWCIENYQDKCRAIIADHVQDILNKSRPAQYRAPRRKNKEKSPGKKYSYTDETTGTVLSSGADEEDEGENKGQEQHHEEEEDGDEGDELDEEEEIIEDEEINEMEVEMLDLLNPEDDA